MAAETVQGHVTEPPVQPQPQRRLPMGTFGMERKQEAIRWLQSKPSTPQDIADNRDQRRNSIPLAELSINDFELLKTLGTGTFARVWLVRLKESKSSYDGLFALKILRKADVVQLKQVEHVCNEHSSLQVAAGHPFITTMFASFSDNNTLYMLLEYCPGGEIFSYLRKARRFTEETTKFYAAEIVLALGFLHDVEGVAYRDLKPENVLLDRDGHIKLVDFGFAKQLYSLETYTLCGTPEYLAPEVIHNCGHGLAVDWWALGILIYEFLVGQPPFWDPSPMAIYEQIVQGHLRFPQHVSREARDLISGLCKTNPSERLGHISGGTRRIKEHAFFNEVNWDDVYNKRSIGPIIPHISDAVDTGNFEDYPEPPDPSTLSVYTDEMRDRYEHMFQNF